MRRRLLPLVAWAAVASVAHGAPPAPVETAHRMVLNGHPVRYTAEAGQVAIRDVATGEAHGYIFYVDYRLPAKTGGPPRPVTFVWNGGPGADSATLDFHVAGPKRAVDGRLVDNPKSWLAGTDLVFVDPVGTGFSRPTKAEYESEFYGTIGDVASVTEFVRSWRILHGAEDAPLYLIGESWGAGRAGSVGYALQKRGVPVTGLMLISGGAGLNSEHTPRNLAEALRVVDLAETARFHHKLPDGPASDHAAIERWARTVYAPALQAPEALSDAQRAAILAQLAVYTGLPADQIDAKTLRITPRGFRTGLLKAQGKTLDVFDMRKSGAERGPPEAPAILRFLRHDLGYRTDAPYVGLEPIETGYAPTGKYPQGVGSRWNYATGPATKEEVAAAMAEAQRTGAGPPRIGAPLPSVEELVALNPKVKVLVAAGQYDSLNSCAANAETGQRLAGAVAQAVTFRCYTGGHMMYGDEATRLVLSQDVIRLVGGAR